MPGINISEDDLRSIVGALVTVADSGANELQAEPDATTAANLATLYDLIARLLEQCGHKDAAVYRHNSQECTRMVAAFELAKICGTRLEADIALGENSLMDSLFDFAAPEAPTLGALVPRATVRDMVKRRQKALEAFAQAHTALAAADSAFDAAKAAHNSIDQRHKADDAYLNVTREEERHFLSRLNVPNVREFTETARKVVDRRMWSVLVELTELEKLMDKQAKDQLRQQLMDNVPEATEDNIFATLQTFVADADMIFKRGIANCFTKLDRRFRSHDGWKVGGRIILDRCFDEWGSWSYHSHQRDTLIDIERTFGVLDGVAAHPAASIVSVVQHERSRMGNSFKRRQSEHDGQYFKIRCYQNGNAHLWFKREDLVAKVNKILGEYYNNPIPEEREAKADPLSVPKTSLAKNYGFFPTPERAVEDVMNYAPLYQPQERGKLVVLEPSAGTGNLARALVAKGCTVDCIEVHPGRAEALFPLARGVKVADFLSVAPTPIYDRVVMNPPFDRERDIDHVMHALKFLKPDGCLVAIMSAGTEFRETKKSTAFRALMEQMKATWRDLPLGSFASVGTYVNTVMLRVWADGRRQSQW